MDSRKKGYDAFEMHPVDMDENNLTGEKEEYIESFVYTWSVFGHKKGEGLEEIADFYNKEDALLFLNMLNKALED